MSSSQQPPATHPFPTFSTSKSLVASYTFVFLQAIILRALRITQNGMVLNARLHGPPITPMPLTQLTGGCAGTGKKPKSWGNLRDVAPRILFQNLNRSNRILGSLCSIMLWDLFEPKKALNGDRLIFHLRPADAPPQKLGDCRWGNIVLYNIISHSISHIYIYNTTTTTATTTTTTLLLIIIIKNNNNNNNKDRIG